MTGRLTGPSEARWREKLIGGPRLIVWLRLYLRPMKNTTRRWFSPCAKWNPSLGRTWRHIRVSPQVSPQKPCVLTGRLSVCEEDLYIESWLSLCRGLSTENLAARMTGREHMAWRIVDGGGRVSMTEQQLGAGLAWKGVGTREGPPAAHCSRPVHPARPGRSYAWHKISVPSFITVNGAQGSIFQL